MYKLNGIDIGTYGAVAASRGDAFALVGAFDFPKRKGETERNWDTGIEPFVEAEDLEFDGRTLTLSVWLLGVEADLEGFKQACISARTLTTDCAAFSVVLKEGVKVKEYIGHNVALASATFWQQEVDIPALDVAASGGTGYQLDGYNLRDAFGIRVSERQDNNGVGKRLEVDTTLPYTQTRYRDHGTAILKCYMRGEGFAELYRQMGLFHALCSRPGLRALHFPDGLTLSGYVREGFAAKAEHSTKLSFDFKLRIV